MESEPMFRRANAEQKRQAARAVNPKLYDRLMAKADVRCFSECWEVKSARNKWGYGVITVDGRKQLTHRVSFSLYWPNIETVVVRHNCNNPACINPAHLRPGTHKDNAEDRFFAGHEPDRRGVKNGRSKLTDDLVREIRRSTENNSVLGRRLGVTNAMVSRIRLGDAWTHVKDEV